VTDEDTSAPQEVVREMTARARSMGWDVEWNWRDTEDGTWSYDAYLWRVGEEPS